MDAVQKLSRSLPPAAFSGVATRLLRALRRMLHAGGVDIRRWPPAEPSIEQLVRMLDAAGVGTVLDIGANVGQFGQRLRRAGFAGKIYSVEPCATARGDLQKAAGADPHWIVLDAMALGDRDGEAEINLYSRSDMNSLRPLSAAGQAAFPRLAALGKQRVPVRRLDGLLATIVPNGEQVALKIDTQGAEREVLAGAGNALERAPLIQIELAMEPLYEGAGAFEEIFDLLRSKGFRLATMTPVACDKRTGRPLDLDAVFLR